MLCQLHDGHLLFGRFNLVIWKTDRCRLEELQCSSTAPLQGDATLVWQQGGSHITRPASCRHGVSTLLLAACVPDTGQHRPLHLLFIVSKTCFTLSRSSSDILASTVSYLCPAQPSPACPASVLSCPCPLSCLIWFAIVWCFCLLLHKWV